MLRYNTTTLYMRKISMQIMDKIEDYPLTLVTAPIGYGKTTAVHECLKHREAIVLWQTLVDDSVNGFWKGFVRLLAKIDTQSAGLLGKLGVSDDSVFLTEAMELLESIVFLQKTILVIDDYHLLSSNTIDRFFETLVRSVHHNLHIVIISRQEFGDTTTELLREGYCYCVTKNDLEFSPEEILEYYKLCGICLSSSEVVALYNYTEGWISAVYLCMLGFLQEGRLAEQVRLHELIEKVVYRHCSVEEKEFLLQLCVFDSFTLQQAQELYCGGKVPELLQELMAKNAFIKYDARNERYQIHNIFISYLRIMMEKLTWQERQAIFRAAGIWYVTSKDYIQGMKYFYKAADFDKLLATLEEDKGRSINNEHKEALMRYFTECPLLIKQKYPMAALLYATELFALNEVALFAEQCQVILSYIGDLPPGKMKKRLLGELEILYGFAKYNDISAMSVHHQQAYALLNSPSELFDNQAPWTFGSPSILYMFYRQSGKLKAAVTEIIQCMPYYSQITVGHGSGAEDVMEAEYYYYTGNFAQTEIKLQQAMAKAEAQQQWSIMVCILFLHARLAFGKGDLSLVMKLLQRMRSEVTNSGQYMLIHIADLCEALFYAYLNQENKLAAWILGGQVAESRLPFPSHGFFYIVYGKVLLLRGEYLKLLGLREEILGIASVFPNVLAQVYIYIYVAVARHKLHHREEAMAALTHAIDRAEPDKLLMPFVENGEELIEILTELANNGKYIEFIKDIKERYGSFVPVVEVIQEKNEIYKNQHNFTSRELEISNLVATGLSNYMIGKTLHIAEVTVKKTLQNIYAKLGIRSRVVLTRIMLEMKNSTPNNIQ